mgnify:CR=1 FL=1
MRRADRPASDGQAAAAGCRSKATLATPLVVGAVEWQRMHPPRNSILLAAALLAALSGCDKPRPTAFQGYVEGEFLYLAAPLATLFPYSTLFRSNLAGLVLLAARLDRKSVE